MNLSRKIILILYILAVVFLTTVYLPYKAKRGKIEHRYYSSIWSDYKPKAGYLNNPEYWSVNVNTKVLGIEIFALSITAGTLFVLLRRKV